MYKVVSLFLASALLALSTAAIAETHEGVSVPAVEPAKVEYPREALRRGEQGEVLVRYRVNEQGRAENIEVLESSNRVFNTAAVRAVRESRYARTFSDGRPVQVDGVVQRFEFVFDLDR